jgi:hypothetical protein
MRPAIKDLSERGCNYRISDWRPSPVRPRDMCLRRNVGKRARPLGP